MNVVEERAKQKFEKEGWKVLRNGWPDFLLVKVNEKGQFVDIAAVEVKSRGSGLSRQQKIVCSLLAEKMSVAAVYESVIANDGFLTVTDTSYSYKVEKGLL